MATVAAIRPRPPNATLRSEIPLARLREARPERRVAASGLHEPRLVTKCVGMITRKQWRQFFDKPKVEWSLFAAGVVLIIVGLVVAPLPGPGGIFFLAPGLALVLKSSMWAKRRYVRMKRWQPKAGRWTDWALRRPSAKRREAMRKAQLEQEKGADPGAPVTAPQPGTEN